MSEPALEQGDFVWCAFPEREAPTRPGSLHIGYTLAVALSGQGVGAIVAYTTTRPWLGERPIGVLPFNRDQAALVGQERAFVLDLRRLAYLPVNAQWFPRLLEPRAGKLGRASESLRRELSQVVATLAKRRPETLARLGPLWGGGPR